MKKYPRTPHLFPTAAATRDDRVLTASQADQFLQHPLYVTEKLDGANVGISFDLESGLMLLQSRGHYLVGRDHPQFDFFKRWAYTHEDELRRICGLGVLYGEWLYATHAIRYAALPDYFLAFALLEGERWATRPELDTLLGGTRVQAVPLIAEDVTLDADEARTLASDQSAYYDGPREGIVLSVEYADLGVVSRAKLVRQDFACASDAHWTTRHMQKNLLAEEA